MKRAGIITILKVNNYGAELQAYALHKKLLDLNIENEIIDYLYYTNPDYVYEAKAAPKTRISLKNKVKWKVQQLIVLYNKCFHSKANRKREERFKSFHKKYTKLSNTYRSLSSLTKVQLDYDVFLVGSDQVWNPNSQTNLEPYFLSFAPQGKKKIAYASSFGVSEINDIDKEFYKTWLNNIDILSSREQRGVELIHEITGREAVHVLDPTLLLTKDEWSKIAHEYTPDKPYILLYVLTHSPYIVDFALKIASEKRYEVIQICKSAMKGGDKVGIKYVTDAGPEEFLGYFKNASFVLSNSFHGTIFSVHFQIPFFTIAPAHKTNNSRQIGLLNLLHLENRLIKEGEEFPSSERYPIDYSVVNNILEQERTSSIAYLKASIL